MISTLETAPSPHLQPYVKSFTLREFNTAEYAVAKPLHANHEMYMTIYLNDKAPLPANYNGCIGDQSFIFGLQTNFHGVVHFNGYFRLFCIVFRPNGFYKLFGIPPSYFTNGTCGASDIFAATADRLQLQLQECCNFSNMVKRAEIILASYVSHSKAKDPHNSIYSTSNLLLRHSGNISVEWLASEASMSLKTFERSFMAQVGVSPKLFARITRFNTALSLKLMHQERNWTSIAHQCGYFDQMHFIKDFKAFTGESPFRFLKTSPPPKEDFTYNAVIAAES